MYRTAILPVALYGCETWLVTSREETKWQEAGGRKLHDAEIHYLYPSINIFLPITSWCGVRHVRGGGSNVYRLLPGQPAHLEYHGVYEWIIIKLILNRLEDVEWMNPNSG